ncbi:Ig-like domain-containing protein [Aquimarina sp. AU474]|uniref:Ig-like domain-containing protein n=1 Tax=Aquimarina sp. AU474 TaxID=2108529 RepID=UPI000D69E521|nr:Ig-like domain-containing protein [Aquimarina sp. AU474]
MNKRSNLLWSTLLLLILVVSCAKKGSITGGEKDETPPVFVKAFPPNFSTNFKANEIRIYFDEYIKLKEAQKQIIVSPPMDPKPTITPLGGASKFVKIKFLDTLLQNTTYSINFGESIEDNNEGNTQPFFRYVFSTGDFLDSLHIKGTITDAIKKEAEPNITVALYEVDENYSDSLIFNTVPRYITNTLDSTEFNFYNLKKGKFKLIALKDQAGNYKYEPKQDKIGFYEEIVSLPEDTAKIFNLNIFKETLAFKALLPKQISKNEFVFPYEGEVDSMKIKLLSKAPDTLETLVIADKETDSLHYWFKPFFKADSLIFEVSNSKKYRDTLVTRFKDQYKDSIQISSSGTTLALNKNFVFSSITPLDTIDEKRITLTDKDTIDVPFSIALDKTSNEAELIFEKSENNRYNMTILPESILDFVGNTNDTIYFRFLTKKLADYGTIFFTLENVETYPVIVQVTNEKQDIITEKTVRNQETLTFDYLEPSKYYVRVIFDSNDNGKWDPGNFLKGIQPEKVSYFPEIIDVRANWEIKQTFILE